MEDEFPTAAAQPETSARGRKHTNGLSYNSTEAGKIVAAPGGCLFAIGKIDGSVELWTAEGQALPDRPHGLVTPEWPYRPDDPSSPPKNFRQPAAFRDVTSVVILWAVKIVYQQNVPASPSAEIE